MRIKLFNKIDQVGLDQFDKDFYYAEDIDNEDGILVRSASLHDYEFPKELKAIARAGAGVNNIPIESCSKKGIVVFNTPGANANAVKELTLCALLLASRKIVEGVNWTRSIANDDDFSQLVEKGKGQFAGPEIASKKLGVIGLGAIGVNVANAAIKLGMDVLGYDPYISVNAAWNLSKWVKHVTNLDEIFASCDYVTIHIPSTPETKGLINKAAIAKMKEGVRLLNLARGDLIIEDDVIEALRSRKISYYVTDFGSKKLVKEENVLCLPHLGASTPESEENCAKLAVKELMDYLQNGNIRNSINLPSIVEPRTTSVRICIIHRNVPNMLAKLTTVIGESGINIENMYNKAKGDYAYTIIDTESHVDKEAFDHVDNVIRVRIIKD